MFHTNKPLTTKALAKLPTNKPNWELDSWAGVPHAELFEFVEGCLQKRGWHPTPAICHRDRSGTIAAAYWLVKPSTAPPVAHTQWVVGCDTGTSRHRQTRLYLGLLDKKCQRYGCLGAYGTSAMRGDLGTLAMRPLIKGLDGHLAACAHAYTTLASTPASNTQALNALVYAARRGLIAWSRLRDADFTWRSAGVASCWGLLLAHNAGVAKNPGWRQMAEMYSFTQIIMKRAVREVAA